MESLEFLLSMRSEERPGSPHIRGPTLSYTRSKDKQFVSLEDYEEVMNEEVDSLRSTIFHLREIVQAEANQSEPMDEENMCTICYANEIAVEFLPCHHTSCRQCIKQQLMSTRECFYCKTNVDSFQDIAPPSDHHPQNVSVAGPSTSR